MRLFIQTMFDAVSFGSLYAMFALGVAVIFGIMRLANFAHGELIMVAGFTLALLPHVGWPILLFCAIAVAIVFALGMERIAFRPVRSASPATLLITSFALSYFLQNLASFIFGALPRTASISTALTAPVQIGSISVSRLTFVTIGFTIVALVALGLFFKRTSMGVQMRAAAEDLRTARILGVRANRVIAVAFAISGVLAGLAAFLLVAQTGSVTPAMGTGPLLVAFIATVLGGLGSLRGAVLGGYVLGLITVLLQVYLPLGLRPTRDAFAYAAVILILLVRPQGLFVGRQHRARV